MKRVNANANVSGSVPAEQAQFRLCEERSFESNLDSDEAMYQFLRRWHEEVTEARRHPVLPRQFEQLPLPGFE
jgi:hypothetical protein